jgi:hypothetical protein
LGNCPSQNAPTDSGEEAFFKTENGARVGDIFMSLIYTAELSGVNPLEYLTELLKHPEELRRSPHEWMPWNYQSAVAVAEAAHRPVLTIEPVSAFNLPPPAVQIRTRRRPHASLRASSDPDPLVDGSASTPPPRAREHQKLGPTHACRKHTSDHRRSGWSEAGPATATASGPMWGTAR